MGVWNNCLGLKYGLLKQISTSNKERLCVNAGFFPESSDDDVFWNGQTCMRKHYHLLME